jgi:steroid 5-alpha reductase family enzyme
VIDAVATVLFLALFLTETIADEQQWAFQQAKHRKAPRRRAVAGQPALVLVFNKLRAR